MTPLKITYQTTLKLIKLLCQDMGKTESKESNLHGSRFKMVYRPHYDLIDFVRGFLSGNPECNYQKVTPTQQQKPPEGPTTMRSIGEHWDGLQFYEHFETVPTVPEDEIVKLIPEEYRTKWTWRNSSRAFP